MSAVFKLILAVDAFLRQNLTQNSTYETDKSVSLTEMGPTHRSFLISQGSF